MTRVIHTGDTHSWYQQYNAPERRRDFLEASRGVAEDTVDDDIDAVIHAGDLFHDRRPGLVDHKGAVEILRTHADWDTERLLSEATVDFDAVLLGDNHAVDTAEVQETWVTYCGLTEHTSASEREEREYNLVTFDSEVAISRRTLPSTREFAFVDVELEETGTDETDAEADADANDAEGTDPTDPDHVSLGDFA